MASNPQPRDNITDLVSILGHAENVLQSHRNYAYTILSVVVASQLVLIADLTNKIELIAVNEIYKPSYIYLQIYFLKILILIILLYYFFSSISRFRKNIYRFNFRVTIIERLLYIESNRIGVSIIDQFASLQGIGMYSIFRFIMNKFDYEKSLRVLDIKKMELNLYNINARYDESKNAFKSTQGPRWDDKEFSEERLNEISTDVNKLVYHLDLVKNSEISIRQSNSDRFLGEKLFVLFLSIGCVNSLICLLFLYYILIEPPS